MDSKMNERIRELARQACITIVPEPFDDASRAWNNTMEKFAELIVEEVYDYILNATFDDEPWPSRKDVKQHFGVEE
jgi:predicted metal-dependent phosphoesterase TrpH